MSAHPLPPTGCALLAGIARSVGAVLLLITLPGPGAAAAQTDEAEALARERAISTLEGDPTARGALRFRARLVLAEDEGGRATLELLSPDPLSLVQPLRVWIVLPRIDEEPRVLRFEPPTQELSGSEAFLFRATIDLPDDFLEGVAVLEEISSGRWGVVVADLADEPLRLAGRSVTVFEAPAEPAGQDFPESARPTAIRLLPPRRGDATGKTRFRTLVSDPLVDRVVFMLDGRQAATDRDPPFSAVLDLGPTASPRTVSVVAYAPGGEVLGEDSIAVNAAGQLFRVLIIRLGGDPQAGAVEVEAEVTTPAGSALRAVEFYYNERLAARLDRAPFRARIETPEAGPADFVRVLARLADGSTQEDARLLGASAERVEVNLVELYAVVTDRDGEPVRGLERGDFRVRVGGRRREIERFGPAQEVPLVLGLVIDTSASMEALMPDTKLAGSEFLDRTLRAGDSSFLVDFDTRPRLAHAVTEDLVSLLNSFRRLKANGYTALYDAIIFSLLQFEGAEGRRALVLLTDGDDYRSRFGLNRCVRYGRDAGVPVYILGLAGLFDPRLGVRKTDLEGITAATGGRIFYINDVSQLAEAYATIDRELRNQYLLAFTTARPLTAKELDSVRVEMERKELEVRAVVGGRRID